MHTIKIVHFIQQTVSLILDREIKTLLLDAWLAYVPTIHDCICMNSTFLTFSVNDTYVHTTYKIQQIYGMALFFLTTMIIVDGRSFSV